MVAMDPRAPSEPRLQRPRRSGSQGGPAIAQVLRPGREFARHRHGGRFALPRAASRLKPRWFASARHLWIPSPRFPGRELTPLAGPSAGAPFGAVWASTSRLARSMRRTRRAAPTGGRLKGTE